ncbi:hypothetical protein PG985_007392 [Apiospora marii]|uniref:uncharacterized protein n=1 Tax=Apiospora marii TaxID=335849 RepID=UPI00312DB024
MWSRRKVFEGCFFFDRERTHIIIVISGGSSLVLCQGLVADAGVDLPRIRALPDEMEGDM